MKCTTREIFRGIQFEIKSVLDASEEKYKHKLNINLTTPHNDAMKK